MLGLDMQAYTSTSTGAGNFIVATIFTGGVPAVRNFGPSDYAKVIGMSRKGATAGSFRIRSSLLHDDLQAIRFKALGADPTDHTPLNVGQLAYAQDTLLLDGDGTNTEVEAYTLSYFYSNLPGVAARLHMPSDVTPLIDHIVVQQVTISAVAPPNPATALLTSLYNVTKANRDYAVLGIVSDTALCGVGLQGADTGNLVAGFGIPADTWKTKDIFMRKSLELGVPLVPVINAANAISTNVVVVNDVAAAGANIGIVLGLLRNNLSS